MKFDNINSTIVPSLLRIKLNMWLSKGGVITWIYIDADLKRKISILGDEINSISVIFIVVILSLLGDDF